jgi:hypothetical protein
VLFKVLDEATNRGVPGKAKKRTIEDGRVIAGHDTKKAGTWNALISSNVISQAKLWSNQC